MSEQITTNEIPNSFYQFATWHWPFWSCCTGERGCCQSCEDKCIEISRAKLAAQQEKEDE